ncbi:MAG: ChbG/HpnK family deacetylase [Myxococcales bacterium]|nr:ChbG/HpnK family deacetylase [Myxococcales bacterium]
MSGRRVILNADDFGYDPAVSRGIVRAMKLGVVSSTTMMVNTPHSEDAATLSDGLALGLHLNLARWAAVSRPGHQLVERDAATLERAFVHDETLAQLDRLKALVGREATHVDVHKHLHRHAAVLDGVCDAASSRGLAVRSIDAPMRATLRARGVRTNDVFLGDAGATAWWTPSQFAQTVSALPPEGLIELMCHPGFAPSVVTSGYSAQREVELETFCAPEARAVLAARAVTFEAWR